MPLDTAAPPPATHVFFLTPDQWTALTAIATLATALIAGIAAVAAFMQVRHARELREEQAQPVVTVGFEPLPEDFGLLDLVIRNTGLTIAYDVKVLFEPELRSTFQDDYPISASHALTEGIPTLPPGGQVRGLFDNLRARFDEATGRFNAGGLPSAYDLTVTYRDTRDKQYALYYRLSLDIYAGLSHITRHGMHDVAQHLKTLAGDFHDVVNRGKLRVSAHDGDFNELVERRRWQEMNEEHERRTGQPVPMQRFSLNKFDYLAAREAEAQASAPLTSPSITGRPKLRAGQKIRRARANAKPRQS